MGRPNNFVAIQAHVKGLSEAKAAFLALPETTRAAMNEATETTISELARHAKARILASPSIQTRSLYNAIAWSMNRKSGRGRVGVAAVTTTLVVGGKKIRVKGIIQAGKGGSASKAAGARKIVPSHYAHFVEFGRRSGRRMNAEPFMIPAAESQKGPYLQRCQAAGRDIERNTAAIGMRNL